MITPTPRNGFTDPFGALLDDLVSGWTPARMTVARPGRTARTAVHGAPVAYPRVDIEETDDAVYLTADLPGVDPGAVEVSVDGDRLTLKGERKIERSAERSAERDAESDDAAEGYRRTERFSGAFERRFTLADTVDREAIDATYRDGVLRVRLPKREALKPRRIEIQPA